jgi:hypothetical protein
MKTQHYLIIAVLLILMGIDNAPLNRHYLEAYVGLLCAPLGIPIAYLTYLKVHTLFERLIRCIPFDLYSVITPTKLRAFSFLMTTFLACSILTELVFAANKYLDHTPPQVYSVEIVDKASRQCKVFFNKRHRCRILYVSNPIEYRFPFPDFDTLKIYITNETYQQAYTQQKINLTIHEGFLHLPWMKPGDYAFPNN